MEGGALVENSRTQGGVDARKIHEVEREQGGGLVLHPIDKIGPDCVW